MLKYFAIQRFERHQFLEGSQASLICPSGTDHWRNNLSCDRFSPYGAGNTLHLDCTPNSCRITCTVMCSLRFTHQTATVFCNIQCNAQLTCFGDGLRPCVRRLLVGLLSRRPGFSPRSVGERFVVQKWHYYWFLSRYFCFPCRYHSTNTPYSCSC